MGLGTHFFSCLSPELTRFIQDRIMDPIPMFFKLLIWKMINQHQSLKRKKQNAYL